MIHEQYSSTLKSFRTSLGMTQAEVSKKAKISRNYYSEIETGKRKPSFEVMERLNNVIPVFFLKTKVDNSSQRGVR